MTNRAMAKVFQSCNGNAKRFHHMTLRAIGRHDMEPGEKVKVFTPERSYRIEGGGSRVVDGGRRPFTLDDSVRVVAKGDDPASLLARVENRLELKEREPQAEVKKGEVMRFLLRVANDPAAYTESFVYSQLDIWRRRALPFLRLEGNVIDEHRLRDYARAMRRYIERAHPADNVPPDDLRLDTRSIMRFGRRQHPGWGYIGYNGWPLERRLPSRAEILVFSGMELIADWRKRDFFETFSAGLDWRGVTATMPHWPKDFLTKESPKPLSFRRWAAQPTLASVSYDGDVSLTVRRRGGIFVDQLEVLLRAASMLMGERALAGRLTSTPPEWWLLDKDPLNAVAADRYVGELGRTLWDYTRALRFVSSDRWMRLQRDMTAKMIYGNAPARHGCVWGVIAEGRHMRHARAILHGAGHVLKHHGRRVSSPAG